MLDEKLVEDLDYISSKFRKFTGNNIDYYKFIASFIIDGFESENDEEKIIDIVLFGCLIEKISATEFINKYKGFLFPKISINQMIEDC